MDRADNGATATCKELQKIDALEAGRAIETTRRFIEEHDLRARNVSEMWAQLAFRFLTGGLLTSSRAIDSRFF
jgi:hypothetical protein